MQLPLLVVVAGIDALRRFPVRVPEHSALATRQQRAALDHRDTVTVGAAVGRGPRARQRTQGQPELEGVKR